MTILQNYLKSKRVQKALNTRPGEEGFSLVELVVVIAVLAILSEVAIPAFTNVQANARASAVQNGMVNGLKECAVRDAEGETTTWAAVASFANTTANPTGQNSNFSVYLDANTGAAVKRCTVPAKPGCQTVGGVNIWK